MKPTTTAIVLNNRMLISSEAQTKKANMPPEVQRECYATCLDARVTPKNLGDDKTDKKVDPAATRIIIS